MKNFKKTISLFIAVTSCIGCFDYPSSSSADEIKNPLYGDLNGDSVIDVFDVIQMRQAVNNGDDSEKYDLDYDGKVDYLDLEWLNLFCKGECKSFPAYVNVDTDKDGLPDFYEMDIYHTDYRNADPDNDKIPDYYEIILESDPFKAGPEAAEDKDGDKVNNLDEALAGTNPCASDSDQDSLDDYYELNVSKTSPVKEDTDGDMISDADEIKLKLDPNNTKSDGTPDKERIFKQTISADSPVLKSINTEDNAYELSIVINASGCADSCLKARESSIEEFKDGSAVGITPRLTYDENFIVKDVTLNFAIKEEFRENVSHYFDAIDTEEYYDYKYSVPEEVEGIKRLNVFKYFEDDSMILPIETGYDIDNNIVSVKLEDIASGKNKRTNIGSFSLVDLEVWAKMLEGSDVSDIYEEKNPGEVTDMSLKLDTLNILADEKSNATKTDNHSKLKNLPQLSDESFAKISKNYSSNALKTVSTTGEKYFTLFGHTYTYVDAPGISWEAARVACKKRGGHLMTFNSPMEFNLLNDKMSAGRNGGLYWLGAYGGTGHWRWITGESMSYIHTLRVSSYSLENCYDYFSYVGNKFVYVPHMDYLNEVFPSISRVKGYVCEWEPGSKVLSSDLTDSLNRNNTDRENSVTIREAVSNASPNSDISHVEKAVSDVTGNSTIMNKELASPFLNSPTEEATVGRLYIVSTKSSYWPTLIGRDRLNHDFDSSLDLDHGHSFLVYQSKHSDTLDVSGFNGGYKRYVNDRWAFDNYGTYSLSPFESIVLGANAVNDECHCAYFNVEAYKYHTVDDIDYIPNYYHGEDITQDQLDELIEAFECEADKTYDYLTHNCTRVAINVWNRVSDNDIYIFSITELLSIVYPRQLADWIAVNGGIADMDLNIYSPIPIP